MIILLMKKLTKNKNIFRNLISLVIIIIILIIGYSINSSRVNKIIDYHEFALARLTDIDDGGVAFDISIDFYYYVNNRKIKKSVEIPKKYKNKLISINLDSNIELCYAWVAYSPDYPKKSLINLKNIYCNKDTSKIKKPKSINDFY